MMNAQINTVERSPEIRSATPVSNHSPSTVSYTHLGRIRCR